MMHYQTLMIAKTFAKQGLDHLDSDISWIISEIIWESRLLIFDILPNLLPLKKLKTEYDFRQINVYLPI